MQERKRIFGLINIALKLECDTILARTGHWNLYSQALFLMVSQFRTGQALTVPMGCPSMEVFQ
jgi:hypothetical protein